MHVYGCVGCAIITPESPVLHRHVYLSSFCNLVTSVTQAMLQLFVLVGVASSLLPMFSYVVNVDISSPMQIVRLPITRCYGVYV